MAQTLREALKRKSVTVSHSECLELVAKVLGFHDWNVLSAQIQSEHKQLVAEPASRPLTAAVLLSGKLLGSVSVTLEALANTRFARHSLSSSR
jgi:Glyoxalase superfamily protein